VLGEPGDGAGIPVDRLEPVVGCLHEVDIGVNGWQLSVIADEDARQGEGQQVVEQILADHRRLVDQETADRPARVEDQLVGVLEPEHRLGGRRRGLARLRRQPGRRVVAPVDQGMDRARLSCPFAAEHMRGLAREGTDGEVGQDPGQGRDQERFARAGIAPDRLRRAAVQPVEKALADAVLVVAEGPNPLPPGRWHVRSFTRWL
jgi:hypothetical protein